MRKLFTILISLLSVSCNISKTNIDNQSIVLSDKDMPQVVPLKLEKINLNEDFLIRSSCYMYHDSILIVLKEGEPYPLTHMVTLINMNRGNKIGEYFTYGQGPNEFMSSLGYLGGNCLDIRCYVTNKFISFNIDSALIKGKNYNATIVNPEETIFLDCRTINDTTLLATNMFFFDKCADFNANAEIPEFFTINSNGRILPNTQSINFEKLKCLPANVTGCEISVNTNKQRIVCCYHYQPYIKVFDLNMNQIRQINGPEPDDGKYKLEDDNYMLFFDGGVNHYYLQAFNDDENIFVLNNRTHNWTRDYVGEMYSRKENLTTEIFRLDWEGNVIGRYSAKGYNLLYVTYSNTSNTLYIWLNDNGEKALYKAKLSFPPHVTQN